MQTLSAVCICDRSAESRRTPARWCSSMARGSSHGRCVEGRSTLAAASNLTKIGWSARCVAHDRDTGNTSGHDPGSPLARTIQCYLLLRRSGKISFLNGRLVNRLVSYAVHNDLVKSVDAYVPTHIVAHQVRQSIRARIGPGGGA